MIFDEGHMINKTLKKINESIIGFVHQSLIVYQYFFFAFGANMICLINKNSFFHFLYQIYFYNIPCHAHILPEQIHWSIIIMI